MADDTRLSQIQHRLRTLPEAVTLAELQARATQVRDQFVAAEAILEDLRRDLDRAETDVQQVRDREARDQHLMNSGEVNDPKQLQSLQVELDSLARRKSLLEDAELEVMERVEGAEAAVAQLRAERDALVAQVEAAQAAADEATGVLENERAAVTADRAAVAALIPADLMALYNKAGEDHAGIGAAHLHRGRCEGCRLTMTPIDMEHIRAAAPTEVIRCEECRRILVRTEESGLG